MSMRPTEPLVLRALGAGLALLAVAVMGACLALASSRPPGATAVTGFAPVSGSWTRWIESTPEGTVAVMKQRASPAVVAVSAFPDYVRLSAAEMQRRVQDLLPETGRVVARRWAHVPLGGSMVRALQTDYAAPGGRVVSELAVPVPRGGTNPVLVVARDLPPADIEGALAAVHAEGSEVAERQATR